MLFNLPMKHVFDHCITKCLRLGTNKLMQKYSTQSVNCIERIIVKNKKGNTLSLSYLNDLSEQIKMISNNVRVLILASATPSIFSSGHDLSEFIKINPDDSMIEKQLIFEKLIHLTTLIQSLPMPVIAEVRGLAAAAGCQLIAACDIVVASENAKFSTPGVKNGVFCATPGVALYHHAHLSPKHLALMLFTGEPITAKEAHMYGLVSKVFPDNKLEEGTLEIASQIARHSQAIVAMGKKLFYDQMTNDSCAAYQKAVSTMMANIQLDDAQEGIKAFFGKRPPTWKQK